MGIRLPPSTVTSELPLYEARELRGRCRCCVSCILQVVQAELSQLDSELPRLQATFADLGRQLQQASQELEALASQEGSGVYRPEAGPSGVGPSMFLNRMCMDSRDLKKTAMY
jgi:hypothetical protein